jgi:hypothetical protein
MPLLMPQAFFSDGLHTGLPNPLNRGRLIGLGLCCDLSHFRAKLSECFLIAE